MMKICKKSLSQVISENLTIASLNPNKNPTLSYLFEMKLTNLVSGVARYNNIIAKTGRGSYIRDVNGVRYLDLTSGIGVLSTGHCHPHVTKKVVTQCRQLVHAQQNCVGSHTGVETLLGKLSKHLPDNFDNVYFSNSGTDAVENAVKLARKATGKTNIITMLGGFHGRSLGAMSLSTSRTSCREGYQPLMPGVFHLDFPSPGNIDYSIENLHEITSKVSSPQETAAVILEPVLGEGGVVQVDPEFAQYLREWCTDEGVLLISDEVQSGCCRTGPWWSYSNLGIEPDVITFAKGIASGFPLAGVISRSEYFNNIHPNGLGGTYNANAVSVAAAIATIDVLEPLIPEIKFKGKYFARALQGLSNPVITEVRQYGLMLAVELDLPMDTFQAMIKKASEHGILMLATGMGPTLRLLPPLTISCDEIDIAVARIDDWINACHDFS